MNEESKRESLCHESDRSSCNEDQISKESSHDRLYIDADIGGNVNKNEPLLNRYSELDYSLSNSVFESEELLDISNFESDAFEHESGVESVDSDWPRSCDTPPDLDLTEEQALETLKYFTLSLSRANQMTKTHQDLDAVLELLQEKEKDLELAAHIGQSLLERNRNLYKKTEVLENYVNEVEERETQLKHVVSMKDKLLKTFAEDEDLDEDVYLLLNRDSESSAYSSCKDETMLSLHEKCHILEEQNTSLVVDALKLREETDKEEEKEKHLVYECIKELGHAKEQISHLTDEISLKAEDNIEQQEEISTLISTVLDLQERHNHLSEENEGLHETLKHSQESQKDLQTEVSTLHDKYLECFEILMENQREMKIMKERLGSPTTSADLGSSQRQDPRGSLAQEIEETVRKDLETSQDKKKHTNRIMQTVRAANTAKRFPKVIKGGSRPTKSAAQAKAADKPFDFTFSVSGNSSKKESPTMDELRAAVRRLSVSENTPQVQRTRRPWAPEKLQIVKPMEGSATLHKWQSLAQPSMSGLHSVHPGVHVKGGTAVQSERMEDSAAESGEVAIKHKNQSTGSDAVKTPKVARKDEKDKTTAEKQSIETVKSSKESRTPRVVVITTTTSKPTQILGKATHSSGKATQTSGKATTIAGKPTQISGKLAVTGSSASSVAPSNLTEIVKSKLSSEQAISTPEHEHTSLLSKILSSTAAVHSVGHLVNSMPVTTLAKTSFVPTTTTTASSMTFSAFPKPLLVRSRSTENLMHLIKPLNQQDSVEPTTTTPSISAESLRAPNITANRPLPGFGGFVGRLVRSSSNENLAGIKDTQYGFSRSSSSGKLSDMVKNSDLYPKIGKSSSFDTVQKSKRASFQLGTSPPSPSQLELMGGFTFFGSSYSATPAPEATTTTTVASGSTRSMFGALSGLGGFFRPRSKSMDNLGPLPASFSAPTSNLDKSSRSSLVERSMKRFNQAFGPD